MNNHKIQKKKIHKYKILNHKNNQKILNHKNNKKILNHKKYY